MGARRAPPAERLDQETLERAARLLLGPEFKRPLAKLLGPHHPTGARETLDPRAPFRWLAPPLDENGEQNKGWRPIPAWVWPVLAELLRERAVDYEAAARVARRLSLDIGLLVDDGEKQ